MPMKPKNKAKMNRAIAKMDCIWNSVSLSRLSDRVIIDFWRRDLWWKINIRKIYSETYIENISRWWLIYHLNTKTWNL